MTDTKPVAWHFKCDDYESVTLLKEHADAMAAPYGTTPIPLYYAPTLTDEEREAVENMLHLIATKHDDYGREAHYLRSLLERLK